MPPTALIIGCGYIGQAVAERWIAAGRTVYALTRHRTAELAARGITPIVGDVLQPESLQGLPQVDELLYAVGYDRRTGRSMAEIYIGGLRNALNALPTPGRVVYVSSTSVYGQTDGGWVDESSVTMPIEESGRVVLAAEEALRELQPQAIILRSAGQYGPGRVLRREALLRGDIYQADPEKWLNLIHQQDAAGAIVAAFERAPVGVTFNLSDGEPVQRRTFYTESARVLAAPPARFEERSDWPPEPNRRVNARAIQLALGWEPRYTDFRTGLSASI
ncbi:MAG: SDR family oxidoreductase [Gemmataceae bacterium]